MNRFLQALLLTLAIGAISSAVALAQIPRTISFQGVLADAQGILLADGTYTLTLSLYDQSTGGTAIFSESQQVTVVRGVFNAIIGSTSPDGIPAGVAFDRQYWLGVQVNNGAELAPRTTFTSVPYALNAARALVALRAETADTAIHALHAGTADNASYADTAIAVRGGHVASVNGQQGDIEFLGAGSTIVTRQGNQFIIRSTDTSGGGIRRIDNYDGSLVIDPPQGPFVTMFIREGGVQTYHLRDGLVTTEKIADQAVTNRKLGPNSVTTDKIMDGQVMTADIADLNVTNAKLGPNSVTTDKIMDGQVMTADIADLNVTTEKLADGSVTNPKLGADAVTTDKIMDGQVMTADIADFNVTLPKVDPTGAAALQAIIYDGANVVWGSPAPGGPAGGDLTGFYPDPQIAPDAVTSPKILDGEVMTADIADLNVTTEKLADGSVTNPKLGADAVTTDKILDGQVMTADIADANITLPKIDPTGALAGQSITFDGTNVTWGGSSAATSLVIPFSQSADEATTMVTLDNINAGGDALAVSAVGGSALIASATTGYAVEARTTALTSTAVDARSTLGMAFYGQTTGATYAASLLASGPASHGLRIQASEIGFNMVSGRFLGANGTATSGTTLGRSRMVYVVNTTGADATPSTFLFPTVENGTIIIVTTNDPDGALITVGATPFTITRDEAMMFVMTSDGWKGLQ